MPPPDVPVVLPGTGKLQSVVRSTGPESVSFIIKHCCATLGRPPTCPKGYVLGSIQDGFRAWLGGRQNATALQPHANLLATEGRRVVVLRMCGAFTLRS